MEFFIILYMTICAGLFVLHPGQPQPNDKSHAHNPKTEELIK